VPLAVHVFKGPSYAVSLPANNLLYHGGQVSMLIATLNYGYGVADNFRSPVGGNVGER